MKATRIVLASCLLLAAPAVASVGEPGYDAPTDELASRAEKLAESGAYAEAGTEFKRAACFSPR